VSDITSQPRTGRLHVLSPDNNNNAKMHAR
jgi:hypothetical protein